jgi:hypothetical protein
MDSTVPCATPTCIYCQAAPDEEGDHTLPQSWYRKGTDPKLQRLRVPSCRKCGAELKKAEQQVALMMTMARGFDRSHPAAAGVYEGVRKTWDAAGAKSDRERQHRMNRMFSILTRVRPVTVSPEFAVGAATVKVKSSDGTMVDAPIGFTFRRFDLDAVVGKFVRGIHFNRTKNPLPVATKIESFEPTAEAQEQAAQLPGGELSDALLYRYWEPNGSQGSALWFFVLWGQVNIGARVEPPGAAALDLDD